MPASPPQPRSATSDGDARLRDDHSLSRVKAMASPLYLRDVEVERGVALLLIGQSQLLRAIDPALRSHGIGRAHYRLLSHVARWPGVSMIELVDLTGTSKQALSRVMKDLMTRGLIDSREDARDRRRKLLRVTDAGAALEITLTTALQAAMAEAYATAGQGAVSGFWHVLEGLIPVPARLRMADLDRG
jgi:DNA-binding MarR family transcriptional regulator